ncbi:peptide/nickel transport system ATP-binding protein [Acetitomaculum ruminis DSM 5522]|uniref:Peptide/nickel transport system ATP-binding protein n=1 Tax=Acetitomaculum ruminis DSM 5522 TaxID=1120918 RepID=A0A1I0XZN5_9FIRM|nr:ATP-binding cassette domain-containing protein [Acetitomaculum ruminis]SFB05648.1 peptide/nickel transport system ATP-binding protein [Acetitomaculum ruminis DSM 5522]
MDTILKAEHVVKIFDTQKKSSTKAVDDVSFELRKGEVLGIVGESGSGKSTIARMITGLIPITSGEISVKDVQKKNKRQLYDKVQMVFQNPVGSFNPRKTLGYGIGESLKNKGINKDVIDKRVGELLNLCGLEKEYAKKYPHEVSGGQCQRAAIARALAIEPEILICDEATSALDVTVQKQIMELLIKLKKEKELSVIFICHNLALVQMFCDRVIVMCNGKMVESGTADEVINNPKDDYTKNLIDSVYC